MQGRRRVLTKGQVVNRKVLRFWLALPCASWVTRRDTVSKYTTQTSYSLVLRNGRLSVLQNWSSSLPPSGRMPSSNSAISLSRGVALTSPSCYLHCCALTFAASYAWIFFATFPPPFRWQDCLSPFSKVHGPHSSTWVRLRSSSWPIFFFFFKDSVFLSHHSAAAHLTSFPFF